MSSDSIYQALGDLIVEFTTAADDHVLQSWPNRAPTPEDPNFIYMSILNQSRQSTNIHEVDEPTKVETISQPLRVPVQIDCYGPEALTWATIISTILRDTRGIDFLKNLGVTSLFSDEAKNLTGVHLGDEQNVNRWMVEAELQYIGSVSLSTETFTEANVDLIEVYATYPQEG